LISCLICFWKPFWVHILVNKLWKHIWVLGDQNWGFWVKNGKNPKVVVQNCDCTLKRAPKHAPSVQPLVATRPCTLTLKRTGARLSVQGYKPSFSTFWFLFRASGNQSDLCKTLLSTWLITVYDLKPTGTPPRWDWTWSCDFGT